MAAQEKTIELLLQLSNLSGRGGRMDVVARALRTAILLLDADAAVALVASARGRGDRLVLYAGSDTPAALPSTLEASEALRTLARERQALAVTDLSDNPALAEADSCPGVEAGPVLFTPVDQRGALPACLAVYRRRGRARYTANEIEHMLLLAAWLGSALENLRLAAGAERLALTDDLTQTYNARYVRAALQRELQRASRYGQEASVLRIELDRFGEFCEVHGKAAGTRLLKNVASLLVKQVRSFDVLGKHGGDGGSNGSGHAGFLALLPQTDRDGALEVAGRMRAAVEAAAFAPLEAGAVTATFGVASFPSDGVEVEALLAVAERALEQGRGQGGNCVATATRKAA